MREISEANGREQVEYPTCDDVELSYPDAIVAEKLCGCGPCFHLSDTGLDAT
jgi:hypothetical protein